MGRGPRKHMKRVAAPSHWMLDKMTGVYAPRPSPGPHRLRECLPLVILLRNRLKYALTYNEVKLILQQRLVEVDGKVRTDKTYPAGFMDVIRMPTSKDCFRLLYDTKGRFTPHRITEEEGQYKLCRVKRVMLGPKRIPHAITHDGRTVRFVHPDVKAHDTIKLELHSGEASKFISFGVDKLCMITGGHNVGRVGTIVSRERHLGGNDMVHLVDKAGHKFATRITNVFCIGASADKPWVSLRAPKGIKLGILEDRARRLKHEESSKGPVVEA
eukprot:GHVU01069140.1.p1 GENE.GHVU01069140.1~~GHVU01069140.1.p1  ORF type:complete len:271 (-),score=23.80 GHVU01069140.1:808-1620(-)